MVVLVAAAVLAWLACYWVAGAEIIVFTTQITESVPAIPGLAVFLLLLALNPLLRRLPLVRGLSTGEIVVFYLFVTLATNQLGCGIGRYLLGLLTGGYYYATAAAPTDTLVSQLPAWVTPTSPLIHRWFYEGSPTGAVPWGPWAVPIAVWSGFFVVLGGTLLCLMLLNADRWIEQERLAFPLVRLPIEIMGAGTSGSFFRNPLTWVGLGAALLVDGAGIVRGVFFGRGGGIGFPLDNLLKGYPWEALRPMQAWVRPELIGLGYLVSTELSFSIWFFWLFAKLQALLLATSGARLSGAPFSQEQGIGAYMVLGLIIMWRDRHSLARAVRDWLVPGGRRDEGAATRQWAVLGAAVGMVAMVVFMRQVGMEWWLAIVYLAIVLVVGLVYGRMRAEAGVPLVWAFPYGQPAKLLTNFLGQAPLLAGRGGPPSATAFALFDFLSRGYFLSVSGYEIEGLRLGRQTGLNWRQVTAIVLPALAVGTVASFVFHFRHYYDKGPANIWGGDMAAAVYHQVLQGMQLPAAHDVPRMIATGFGGLTVALLSLARSYWPAFPLGPMGYIVAGAYGDMLWFSFFAVWLMKATILRYGGGRAYLKVLPAFLAFALGHFFIAGVVWSSLGVVFRGVFLRWTVWFG